MIELGISGISDPVEIGAGGFGVVYRADEADLGRTVAVKVLSGNLDEQARHRFERERRAMGTLSGHPNIVTVYRGGYTTAGNAYLVMEYLARGSLADRIKADGPLRWPEVLRLGVQLCGALETAHRAGVLHRDLKPGNVLVSGLGNAKLGDFGIARLQGAPETRSQVVTASLAHAPPEVLTGQRPDPRCDVYSLGSTLLELILGSAPFVRPTDQSMVPILARIAQDPPPRPPDEVLPARAFEVIERAMAKDPADRPPTAADLGRLLMDAQRSLGQAATALPVEGEAPPAGSAVPDTGPVVPTGPADLDLAPVPLWTTGPGSGTGPAGVTTAAPSNVPPHPDPYPDPALTVADPIGAGGGGARRLLLPGALAVAAVVVLGGLLADALGDDTTDTTTATIVGSSSTPSTAFDFDDPTVGGDEPHTGTSISDEPGDHLDYLALNDSTGSISLMVPAAWSAEIELGPGRDGSPFAAASPRLEGGFYDTFAEPGVSVELRRGVPTDLDAALDEITVEGCADSVRQPFDDGDLPGLVEFFRGCDGVETRLIHVVVTDTVNDIWAVVRIQALDDRDFTAAVTIWRSLRLSDNF